jgi:hypothetical protein
MGFKRDGEAFYDFSYGVYLTQRNAEVAQRNTEEEKEYFDSLDFI